MVLSIIESAIWDMLQILLGDEKIILNREVYFHAVVETVGEGMENAF